MEDKKKIEAVLFAVGDKIEEAELSRLTKLPPDILKAELLRLKDDYTKADSTFILLNEGTRWKLTVREDYMPIVQKIVPKTELSRPVLETLAVIAWKSPVLQSSIIDIRSSKAYDHIGELEQVGFITKQKYGRSFMLRLSQQFFEYFDIKDKEQVKDVFKGIKGAEQISSPDKKLNEFGNEGGKEKASGSGEINEGAKKEIKAVVEIKSGANLPAEISPAQSLPAVGEEKDKAPGLPATQKEPKSADAHMVEQKDIPLAKQEPAKPGAAPALAKHKKEKKPAA